MDALINFGLFISSVLTAFFLGRIYESDKMRKTDKEQNK